MANYDDTATVSGSIVRVNDGADSVGLKNWLVTFPASLSGYSEVNGVRSGKNLIKPDKYQAAANNTTLGQNNSTSFGTFLKAGTYTISYTTTGETCYIYRREENDASNTNMGKRLSATFTLESDGNFRFWLYGDGAVSANISNIQIEVGSTSTAYEPYTAPEVSEVDLGRTIYGGTADIVTGEGVDYGLWVNMSDIAWTEDPNRLGVFYGTVAGRKTATADDPSPVVGCTCYDVNNVNVTTGIDKYISGARSYGGNIIFFRDSAFSGYTRAQVQEALQGEKVAVISATQTPFTFTPITAETAKGSNTFWSDQGDSELTYYKDGYGFTSVTIHKETPDGEPVEETRKLHHIIYEGQVDVISGTGLIYRGESGTQYDPPEQISFTPIEIATDEGENTLYADEGDSAITYRKEIT